VRSRRDMPAAKSQAARSRSYRPTARGRLFGGDPSRRAKATPTPTVACLSPRSPRSSLPAGQQGITGPRKGASSSKRLAGPAKPGAGLAPRPCRPERRKLPSRAAGPRDHHGKAGKIVHRVPAAKRGGSAKPAKVRLPKLAAVAVPAPRRSRSAAGSTSTTRRIASQASPQRTASAGAGGRPASKAQPSSGEDPAPGIDAAGGHAGGGQRAQAQAAAPQATDTQSPQDEDPDQPTLRRDASSTSTQIPRRAPSAALPSWAPFAGREEHELIAR